MKLWITTLVAGACLTIGAGVLQAQSADGASEPGGRIQRRGPADGAAPGDRDRAQDRAQDPNQDRQGPGPDGPRPGPMHMGPLMHVLDTDKDGVLSAAEIAAASANLAKLDKNGDGKIDRKELLPPRPQGPRDGQSPRAGQGPRDGKGPQDGQEPRPGDRRPPTPPPAPQE